MPLLAFFTPQIIASQQESLWSMEGSVEEEIPGAEIDRQSQHLATFDYEEYVPVVIVYLQIF